MTINNDLCRVLQVGLTVKLLLLYPGLLPGHDFLVKPAKTTAPKGVPVEVSVLLTEIYMQPDRVLPESAVELAAVADSVRTPIPLKADEQAKALVGTLRVPSAKAFILSGHRLASIRSGANRKGAPPAGAGSAGAVKSESFSKVLINAAAGDNGYAATVGDRLEIVPMTNPALVQAGGEMPCRSDSTASLSRPRCWQPTTVFRRSFVRWLTSLKAAKTARRDSRSPVRDFGWCAWRRV